MIRVHWRIHQLSATFEAPARRASVNTVLDTFTQCCWWDAGLLTNGVKMMPFPPNYRLDKSNRARTKAQKAIEKQEKREEKSARRKQGREDTAADDHSG